MEAKLLEIRDIFKSFCIGKDSEELYAKGYTKSPSAFSRRGKVSLVVIVFFLLNLPKRKLATEIVDFVQYFRKKKFTPSAFSQKRYKVKHVFFIDWNKHLMENSYKILKSEMKYWRGHRLISWDGTTQWVLEDAACKKEFGGQINQFGTTPLGRAVHCYDVLNNFILGGELFNYHQAEEKVVQRHLSLHQAEDIAIYDRRYASWEFMYRHEIEGLKYVIRCNLDFNTYVIDFVASSKRSKKIRMKITEVALKNLQAAGIKVSKESYIEVRLIKVLLDNGEEEILITNLLESKKYPKHIFAQLYHLRWNDETGYDILKNKLQIEIFSGHKVEAIYQEFYATMISYNWQTLLTLNAEEKVAEISKNRKYDYKINRNFAISIIKNALLSFFSENSPIVVLREMTDLFCSEMIPIKPDRHINRVFKKNKLAGKYRTWKNYRRAI